MVMKENERDILWVRIDVPEDMPEGTYPITIYVEDFVGNRAEQQIIVEIK